MLLSYFISPPSKKINKSNCFPLKKFFISIGAGLSKLRERVLLIDLDPQAHFNLQPGHTCARATEYSL